MTNTLMTFENKRLVGILVAIAALLLIPVAARFPWDRFDFIVAGVLLVGTGLICELALRLITRFEYRIAAVAFALLTLFVVWVELATGYIGTRFAGS